MTQTLLLNIHTPAGTIDITAYGSTVIASWYVGEEVAAQFSVTHWWYRGDSLLFARADGNVRTALEVRAFISAAGFERLNDGMAACGVLRYEPAVVVDTQHE